MSDMTTCPRCRHSLRDSRVTRGAVVCRHCDLRLEDRLPDLSAPDVGPNVRRRISVVTWVLAVLIGLGVVAVVLLSFQQPKAYEATAALIVAFALAFAYLDVVVILTTWRYVFRWWRSWKESQSEAGAVALLLVVLIPGVIFGVVSVFFVTCWGILLSKGLS
jgi:hypothetical protein